MFPRKSKSYRKIKQSSKSSSTSTVPSERDVMLGDVDSLSDDADEKGTMSQIEMYQTFVGQQSPSSNAREAQELMLSSRANPNTKSRNKKKKKKLRRWRNRSLLSRMGECFCKWRRKKRVIDPRDRVIRYRDGAVSISPQPRRFSLHRSARNSINNQKYSALTFLPLFLYEQFNQFWNLYFLCVAITQLPIPGSIFEDFWIGLWWTVVLPLAFVVSISMLREAFDDLQRKKRDYLINYAKYHKLELGAPQCRVEEIASCRIRVGDLIVLNEGDRVPCDMVLLYCENVTGTTFIKTDQLDGETDWKLRRPIPSVQKQRCAELTDLRVDGVITVEAPHRNIYEFVGKFEHFSSKSVDALSLENTLWSSTRIASEGTVVGMAVYLGPESREQLNANAKTLKTGLIDTELNRITKMLVAMLVVLSAIMTVSRGVHENSLLYFGRFMLILSDIIPLSLRVYMDLSKVWFSMQIQRDDKIPGTTVRCTTIPEELGRVRYLFTDKTGTLTKNEMILRKLQLTPPLLFESHNHGLIHHHCAQELSAKEPMREMKRPSRLSDDVSNIDELALRLESEVSRRKHTQSKSKSKKLKRNQSRSASSQVLEAMLALALCHNVTPIINAKKRNSVNFEASSPDEIAMVRFAEKCGLKLIKRTTEQITLRFYERVLADTDELERLEHAHSNTDTDVSDLDNDDDRGYTDFTYKILAIFPFTSASKRMGIILQDADGAITFYAKGADVAMKNMLLMSAEEWMSEEVENLSREGLRTLVFAKRALSTDEYAEWRQRHSEASVQMTSSRAVQMASVRESLLEQDLQLLMVSGVEDKLQDNVQATIEMLRNAHIKIWMLTGDKVETAKVIARSSRLISFGQEIYELIVASKREAYHKLDILFGRGDLQNLAIVVDGDSLTLLMDSSDLNLRNAFLEYVLSCNVVIACRCSPQQKAEMVEAVQQMTQFKSVCCAVGDGGNDVSMILRAQVGVGLLGKEGAQASLASDFSISRFEHLSVLLLWHGRMAYLNTAKMAQFVIHRGLIIAVISTLFSAIFYFAAIPLFTGALMVGYTCIYTSMPVFSLVLDTDICVAQSLFYPELYHALQRGDCLSDKTFVLWIMRSFFQGATIMLVTLLLFENELHNIVSIVFTALILTELYNVYLEVHTLHVLMLVSEAVSIALYALSIVAFSQTYFNRDFVFSSTFLVKSLIISAVANIPVAICKMIHKICKPSVQAKLKDDRP